MAKISRLALLAGYFALFIFLLTNCAGVGKQLDPPRVSLAQVQVEEFTGFEAVFLIKLRVLNPNDVALRIKGIEADLEINGKPFAVGVSKASVTIPSFGTELVPVTVYSSIMDIFTGIRGLQTAEQLNYRLTGKLRGSAPNTMSVTLPFDAEGQISFNPPNTTIK